MCARDIDHMDFSVTIEGARESNKDDAGDVLGGESDIGGDVLGDISEVVSRGTYTGEL